MCAALGAFNVIGLILIDLPAPGSPTVSFPPPPRPRAAPGSAAHFPDRLLEGLVFIQALAIRAPLAFKAKPLAGAGAWSRSRAPMPSFSSRRRQVRTTPGGR